MLARIRDRWSPKTSKRNCAVWDKHATLFDNFARDGINNTYTLKISTPNVSDAESVASTGQLSAREADMASSLTDVYTIAKMCTDKHEDPWRMRYNDKIATMRRQEYPALDGSIYLDHAGTALHARSLIEAFSADMMSTLIGNPHSASNSSMTTTYRIEDTRLKVLRLFGASPDYFDVVFVANATAGIKLVVDTLQYNPGGFWYGYHKDSHTSLVGARGLASKGSRCFLSDSAVEQWIVDEAADQPDIGLFAYPGQSNMNGRRLPQDWPEKLRQNANGRMYSLLDAAGLVSTSPLDLSNAAAAPDFTVLSFYKIFGFPDLGALIVRKESAHVFDYRRYFGGGTVEMVSALGDPWHKSKQSSLYARLEDGTLPIRSIMALDCAMKVHQKLYNGLEEISLHTSYLARILYEKLSILKHSNGSPVCHIYKDPGSTYGDPNTQGGIVAFNLLDSYGRWQSNFAINKLAVIRDIHIRIGTLCNPGGMAYALGLNSDDLMDFWNAGFRCGNEDDVRGGKPVGMVRASLGAMSTLEDVEKFVEFINEFFAEKAPILPPIEANNISLDRFSVESLTIYPIKSCAGWQIPEKITWSIRPEGLAWDREWCLVHQGSRVSISQKQCPRMTLIKPSLDLDAGLLRIKRVGPADNGTPCEITVPLTHDRDLFVPNTAESCNARVCGDKVRPMIYASTEISSFFSAHLQLPCHLAWLPSGASSAPQRIVKARTDSRAERYGTQLPEPQPVALPGSFPTPPPSPPPRPLLLANESPILTISRSSLDQLNQWIVEAHGISDSPSIAIGPETFRANIVLKPSSSNNDNTPFIEDSWRSMRLTKPSSRADPIEPKFDCWKRKTSPGTNLHVLGPCRRCQMICIDQRTGERHQEPFVTLAKTRARDGGVWFGIHCGLSLDEEQGMISVGDLVEGST